MVTVNKYHQTYKEGFITLFNLKNSLTSEIGKTFLGLFN